MAIRLYTMPENYPGKIPGAQMPAQVFHSKKGKVLFQCEGEHYIVMAGYSWNGCSPKRRIFGKVIGVSDGPMTSHRILHYYHTKPMLYLASATHDAFAQFNPKGITRKRIDSNFQADMIDVGWKWHQAYYHGVRIWSKLRGYK